MKNLIDRRLGAIFCAAALGLATAAAGTPDHHETTKDGDGWQSLFDGKSLDGWTVRGGKATYEVVDGVIVGTTVEGSPNTFLCRGPYADFVLEFEVKKDPDLNSGVQVRSNVTDQGRVNGPQCEIDDDDSKESGNFWDEARRGKWLGELKTEKAKNAYKHDQWNRFRIVCQGNRYRSWVNGVPCADFTDDTDKTGLIGLQVHSIGKDQGPYQVRWTKLRIKELKEGEEPPAMMTD